MDDRLSALDDATATHLLTRIAAPHRDDSDLPAELTPELSAVLAHTFGEAPAPVSEGDLARAVLRFLAQQPEMRPVLSALLDGPEAVSYGPRAAPAKLGKPITIAVAALLVLQTHVKFERGNDGRWNVLVEKQETGAEILAPIVQKILGVPALGKKP